MTWNAKTANGGEKSFINLPTFNKKETRKDEVRLSTPPVEASPPAALVQRTKSARFISSR